MQDARAILFLTAFIPALIVGTFVLTLTHPNFAPWSIHDTVAPGFAIGSGDHWRGSASAPVTIIEYADTECEFCKRMQPIVDQLYQSYGTGGQVRFVYRYFPLGLWSNSIPEAEALECAARLGGSPAFFAYLDAVFAATQSDNDFDLGRLPSLARTVGLESAAFASCQASSSMMESIIQADKTGGTSLGVSKTPTFFIVAPDGTVTTIVGSRSFPVLDTTIQAALLKKP